MANSTPIVHETYIMDQEVADVPLQNELSWGKSYRDWNSSKEAPSPIQMKHSPINIPFKICRALNATTATKKKAPAPISHPCQHETEKISLLDRSAFTQDQYMDLLSIPHTYGKPTKPVSLHKKKKKKKKRDCCICKIEPCPPRLIQMAVPRKRLVWENWKAYQHVVSTEFITRYDELLKSGFNNLNLFDARYYFKKLNKQKRKALRKKRRLKQKKKLEKLKGDQEWIKSQINYIATAIVDYYKNAPKFLLNFRQLLISENILGLLRDNKLAKIKKRNTRHHGKRTILEMCDKMARAIDDINMFASLHPGAQYEDSAVVYQPSIEGFEGEEEEEEEFYEGSEEGEGFPPGEGEEYLALGEDEGYSEGAAWGQEGEAGRRPPFPTSEEEDVTRADDTFPEGGDDTGGDISYATDEPTVIEGPSGGVEAHSEGEDGGEGQQLEVMVDKKKDFATDEDDDFGLGGMDRDTFEKLIEILSQSSPEDLAKEIGTVPGVTYGDVLEKLKELRDGRFESKKPKPFLEDIMIDWVKKNEPEEVDDPLLEKIHETSTVLSEWLANNFGDKETPSAIEGQVKPDAIQEETEELLDEALDKATEKMQEEENKKREEEMSPGKEAGEDQMPETPSTEIEEAKSGEEGKEEDAAAAAVEGEEAVAAAEEKEGDKAAPGGEEEGAVGDEVKEEAEDAVPGAGGEEEAAEGEEGAEEGEGEEGEKGEEGEEEEEAEEGAKAEGAEAVEEGEGGGDEKAPGTAPSSPKLPGEAETATEIKTPDQMQIPGAGEVPTVTVGAIIKGHKPSKVMEHTPQTICCLSLKIWAYWLLEITHNAHNWTKWVREIIKQVREFVAIIRGDVLLPNGQKRVLYKEEWRQFVKDTEERMVNWRQYSNHVKELSGEIMGTVRGKAVNCCPKCLQDHMIKNVVTAHETMQALSEAINCAEYWQRCLDRILEQTTKITQIEKGGDDLSEESLLPASSSDDFDMFEIVEVDDEQAGSSDSSSYEIEEVDN